MAVVGLCSTKAYAMVSFRHKVSHFRSKGFGSHLFRFQIESRWEMLEIYGPTSKLGCCEIHFGLVLRVDNICCHLNKSLMILRRSQRGEVAASFQPRPHCLDKNPLPPSCTIALSS